MIIITIIQCFNNSIAGPNFYKLLLYELKPNINATGHKSTFLTREEKKCV